ncbi:MAG TPA: cytochrome c biogenesis protein CcsA [Acidobacteriaceae bacterium]|nr:cytochrome c biogenesis protein CcsA [Acidobacteriaceae bacterium]
MFLVWLRVAAILYGVASLLAIPAVLGKRARGHRFCLPAAMGGWFFHLVATVEMMAAAHHLIPVMADEIVSTLALLIVAVFLLIFFLYRTISFGLFALPLAFLLTVIPAIGPDRYTFASPLVRNGWIAFHVVMLLAAYAALLFSILASFLYLVQEKRLKDKQSPGFLTWLPPLGTMDQIAQTTLVLGFCCMTAGLFAGSLIAQEKVGIGYFADPKVLLSFVIWGMYVALLFIRRSAGLRGRRAAWATSGVLVAMLCVWAANLLSGVHSSAHRFGLK